jgi:hypothetical protein
MYERQYNWTPLCPSDPIPGSPDVLDRNAALFRTSASNVGSAITNLARLDCRDENYSEAILKIMEKADSVAASLTLVKSRYEAMEQALTHYAPRLRQAQATSLTALNNATEAARRKNEAWGRIWEAKPRTLSPDTAVRDQAVYEYNRAVSDFGHAKGDIADAKALLAQAIGVRNTAGDTAAGIVREALKDSPLNDDIWDHVGQALASIGKAVVTSVAWIWDHIDEISLVLDVVCLVLTLTGVGAPVAGIIKALSTAARVAKWVSTGKKVLEFGVGVAEWRRTGDPGLMYARGGQLALAGVSWAGGKAAAHFMGPGLTNAAVVEKMQAKATYAPIIFGQSSSAAQVSQAIKGYSRAVQFANNATDIVSGGVASGLDVMGKGAEGLAPQPKSEIKYDLPNFRYEVAAR